MFLPFFFKSLFLFLSLVPMVSPLDQRSLVVRLVGQKFCLKHLGPVSPLPFIEVVCVWADVHLMFRQFTSLSWPVRCFHRVSRSAKDKEIAGVLSGLSWECVQSSRSQGNLFKNVCWPVAASAGTAVLCSCAVGLPHYSPPRLLWFDTARGVLHRAHIPSALFVGTETEGPQGAAPS